MKRVVRSRSLDVPQCRPGDAEVGLGKDFLPGIQWRQLGFSSGRGTAALSENSIEIGFITFTINLCNEKVQLRVEATSQVIFDQHGAAALDTSKSSQVIKA